MTTLVVGGSGFAGRAVVQALADDGRDLVVLSRTRPAARPAGPRWVRGDATQPGLELSPGDSSALRERVEEIVTCFGSVRWSDGPRALLAVHADGMRNVVAFARGCVAAPRIVHVSSILALGRAPGVVGNDVFDVGQSFRNWYEYGKFLAERALREQDDIAWTILRVGPLLGTVAGAPPALGDGLPATLPHLLCGYPTHLADGGRFPCYPADVAGVAELVRHALETAPAGVTWTWYDPACPSLADVLTALCAAWGVTPRIVGGRAVGLAARLAGRRLGVPAQLLDYAQPWLEIDPAVLAVPGADAVRCRPDYLAESGRALRDAVAAGRAA